MPKPRPNQKARLKGPIKRYIQLEKNKQINAGVRELEKFYQTKGREELRLRKNSVQYLEFLTAAKYLEKYLPPASRVLDSCAGSGIYAFHLADAGHKVYAGDLVAYNVETMVAKNQHRAAKNARARRDSMPNRADEDVGGIWDGRDGRDLGDGRDVAPNRADEAGLTEIFCGDALHLPQFADESFQAVLCMGALYHLYEAQKRKQALVESMRLLGSGGLFFCTYMSRFGVVLQNAQGNLNNVSGLIEFIHNGRKGIFYASTPAEMENLLAEVGFTKLCHVALDGIVTFLHQTGRISQTGLEAWAQYHFASCEEPSLLGYSCHNLLVAQKP